MTKYELCAGHYCRYGWGSHQPHFQVASRPALAPELPPLALNRAPLVGGGTQGEAHPQLGGQTVVLCLLEVQLALQASPGGLRHPTGMKRSLCVLLGEQEAH